VALRLLTMAIIAAALSHWTWAESAEDGLMRLDRQWAVAASSDDLQAVFSFWSEDAEIYSPGRPPAIGIEEIRKFVEMRRALPGSMISWEPKVAEVSASGDLGYTRGTYEMTVPDAKGGPATVKGTYVSLWRREKSTMWKCFLEIHSPLPSSVKKSAP
jgi:ketosteroid isomerase-like protein